MLIDATWLCNHWKGGLHWATIQQTSDRVLKSSFTNIPHNYSEVSSCIAFQPQVRHMFVCWISEDSDVAGCLHLCRTAPLVPPAALSLDDEMPALVLLDTLEQRGFEGRSVCLTHQPVMPFCYHDRKVQSKKAYLRCVLAQEALFASGIPHVKSGCANALYIFILRFRKLHHQTLQRRRCMSLSKRTQITQNPMAGLDARPAAPVAPAPIDPDIAGDDMSDIACRRRCHCRRW